MKVLDMPTTTFYREVEAGNIPYKLEKGEKRGMLFPKEAIATTVALVWRERLSMSSLFGTNLRAREKIRRKERWRNDFNKASTSVPRHSQLSSRFAFLDSHSLAWSVLGMPS